VVQGNPLIGRLPVYRVKNGDEYIGGTFENAQGQSNRGQAIVVKKVPSGDLFTAGEKKRRDFLTFCPGELSWG